MNVVTVYLILIMYLTHLFGFQFCLALQVSKSSVNYVGPHLPGNYRCLLL